MALTVFYVLTPAGKAGPFLRRADAVEAARPFGWMILSELVYTAEDAES